MLMQLLVFFHVAFYTLAFGSISFSKDYYVPVDTCFNMTKYSLSGDAYSFIYRCSEDSVWKFTYTDCLDCNCTLESSTMMGGCTNDGSMYRVFNCSYAQQSANNVTCGYVLSGSVYSTSSGTSMGACINDFSGGYYSHKYACAGNGSLLYYEYSDYDCTGTSRVINEFYSLDYRCGNNCGAHAVEYTTTDTCNYAESDIRNANSNQDCNYIIPYTGGTAYAIDVCFSFRQGYYEYSQKYVCSEDKQSVFLVQWMEGADCSYSSSKAYVIAEYSPQNYSFNCNGNTCNGKYRTYTDCRYQYEYSETPIVWNYCQQSTSDGYSFDDYLYQMTTCVGGMMANFYFTDSTCKDFDTFELLNTSAYGCVYELTGCSNTNDIYSSGSMINLNMYAMLVLVIFMIMAM